MGFDHQGHFTLKTQRKNLCVPLPDNEASFWNRFGVMGAALVMLKMRYLGNPVLSSVSPELMRVYADFLRGARIWGYAVRGDDGLPISSPHPVQALAYQAMRELQCRLVCDRC